MVISTEWRYLYSFDTKEKLLYSIIAETKLCKHSQLYYIQSYKKCPKEH